MSEVDADDWDENLFHARHADSAYEDQSEGAALREGPNGSDVYDRGASSDNLLDLLPLHDTVVSNDLVSVSRNDVLLEPSLSRTTDQDNADSASLLCLPTSLIVNRKIQGLFERIADDFLAGEDDLYIDLSPLQETLFISSKRTFSYPGNNANEAWRFSLYSVLSRHSLLTVERSCYDEAAAADPRSHS